MTDLFERISQLPPKRLALLALELQKKLERAESRRLEPVAIVGVGCRFPGAAGPDEFWQLLTTGTDAIRQVPADRWDAHALYDARPGMPGAVCTRDGGFLDRIDEFDPHFFGIAPREAIAMDPQQRLLLEVTWEALEHAGLSPVQLEGSRTAVFIGISGVDFAHLLLAADPAALDVYTASGASHAIAAGRLSYTFGFQGPSVALDTACSSSLVAVHLACQSLRAGECRVAVAGGVNIMVSPQTSISLSRAGMLAPDGRCKTFDAAADGFVRGEGCGVIVLKRLSDAEADGDRTLAIVRGTAVNQDGRSSGITAPNGPAQEAVLRDALERSGLAPADIDYVETHGTGTVLGDPIEVRALGAVLGTGRDSGRPLLIGSVKTNLGHLESAAGIAGLIKTVLALEHEEIPPHLHFSHPNPHIEWEQLPIAVASDRRRWPRSTRPRVAGVSSFGFSGTNAHVLIQETPVSARHTPAIDRPRHLLTLSAKSERALIDLAARYAAASLPDDETADICHTAGAGRAQFPHRLALAGSSFSAMQQRLAAFVHSGDTDGVETSGEGAVDPAEIAFLFTGQGSQYPGMGRELFETHPAFRRTMEQCDAIVAPQIGHSIVDLLYTDGAAQDAEQRLTDTKLTQPALFALEYALASLWQEWGVMPAAVAGHSLGEYVAACVAGVLTLEDALRLVCERARLMSDLPAGGAMASVFIDEGGAEAAIRPYKSTLAVAAVNGPAQTVIAGREADLLTVLARLEQQGVRATRLKVSHAFHSPLVDPALDRLEAVAARVKCAAPRIGLISNVTGKLFRDGALPDAAYWRSHARQAVRFADGVESLRAAGCNVFLEVGPHPALLAMGRDCFADADRLQWVASLRRGRSDWQQLLASVAGLWTRGVAFDWSAFDREYRRRKVVLPTYPFQRQRYWPDHMRPAVKAAEADTSWREWLYEPAWTGARHAGAPGAGFIPATAQLAARAEALAPPLAVRHGVAVYDQLYPALDRACRAYMLDALQRLGWRARAGDRFDADALQRRLRIQGRHGSLLRRMLDVLAEDGVIDREPEGWVVARVPEPENPRELMAELRQRFPECEGELSLTSRCAERLSDVLRGACDPMQVLFPSGALADAEALYQHAPGFRLFNALVAEVCSAAAAARPAGRTLRVLEVGGGTGGTTASVLPALDGADIRYVFSDISAHFTTRARQKFADFDFVEYRTLDIDRDPAGQGFGSGEYDVILASNVLHATRDLRKTLHRVRDLLAPSGLLVLLEGTRPQRFGDLTVGLTDGWWHFEDDLRDSYALMAADRWIEALTECGFSEPVAFPAQEPVTYALFDNQAILLARAPQATTAESAAINQHLRSVAVLLSGDADEAAALAASLRARGRRTITVVHREAWTRIDEHGFGLDLERPDHLRRLFDTLAPEANRLTVIHMAALGAAAGDSSVERVDSNVRRSCGSALAVTRALAESKGIQSIRLTFVTRGSQSVLAGDPPVDVAQASLWGFGRVAALEHPEFGTRLIDIEARGADTDVLAAAIEAADADSQLALRGDERFTLGLRPAEYRHNPGRAVAFDARGTYLVTGGLNGLGLAVAEWMVGRGARHLVLMGRTEPGHTASETIARMRSAGALVTIATGDVSLRSRLREVIDAIDEGAPLRGVMHCAGITDDAAIVQMTWERFDRVLAAKVRGAWHLHELTASMPLDHFVLFSSGAALVGSRGQCNHAAANAFMDALAHHRRASGLAALSVNWGAWSGIGAAARLGVSERMDARGVPRIDPVRGLAALDHLIGAGATQAAVLPVTWSELVGRRAAGALPIQDDRRRQTQDAAPTPVSAVPALSGISAASPARARTLLTAAVEREAARVLGVNVADGIDPRQPLNELGLDSLMAVELRGAIASLVGRPQPATLLFNYPSIGELVEYLLGELQVVNANADDSAALRPGGAATGTAPASDIEDLPEEEIAKLLAGKLADAQS